VRRLYKSFGVKELNRCILRFCIQILPRQLLASDKIIINIYVISEFNNNVVIAPFSINFTALHWTQNFNYFFFYNKRPLEYISDQMNPVTSLTRYILKVVPFYIYMLCLKRSVNVTRKQIKQSIQTN
jgi:hypothetical protein